MEKEGQRVRAKRWMVTINHYTKADIAMFEVIKAKCDYWVYGFEEAPTTGTPHMQCYIVWKDPKTAKQCHEIFPSRGHWEKQSPNSSPLQAADYCKKEGKFEEFGELPIHGPAEGGKATKDKWAETRDLAKRGELDKIDPKLFVGHYKTLKLIKADYKQAPRDLTWTVPPNTWIWGPTGTGKSFYARKTIIGDNAFYIKNAANKWWDKYDGQDWVLIEDMDTSHAYQGYYMKIWADKYAFSVEVKNSGDLIRPGHIVVTSNYRIEDIFPDKSIHEPLKRRFMVIHRDQPWDADVNTVLMKNAELMEVADGTLNKAQEIMNKHKVKFVGATLGPELPKPKLFRQDASGDLVPWRNTQTVIQPESTTESSSTCKPTKEVKIIDQVVIDDEVINIYESIEEDEEVV